MSLFVGRQDGSAVNIPVQVDSEGRLVLAPTTSIAASGDVLVGNDAGDGGPYYLTTDTDGKLILSDESDVITVQHPGFELLASDTEGVVLTSSITEVLEVPDCHLYRDIIFLLVNVGTNNGLDPDDEAVIGLYAMYDRPFGSGRNVPTSAVVDLDIGAASSSWGSLIAQLSGGPLGIWPFPNLTFGAKCGNAIDPEGSDETTVYAWVYGRRI